MPNPKQRIDLHPTSDYRLLILNTAWGGPPPPHAVFFQDLARKISLETMILIQLVAILAIARLMRYPARLVGLPAVIGEMLAGFLLGPTVFGSLFPSLFHLAFPATAIRQISALGSLIVTAYCFVIGLEF